MELIVGRAAECWSLQDWCGDCGVRWSNAGLANHAEGGLHVRVDASAVDNVLVHCQLCCYAQAAIGSRSVVGQDAFERVTSVIMLTRSKHT